MSADTIFNTDDKPVAQNQEAPVTNESSDKPIDQQAVIKRLEDSQAFIEQLKKENSELRLVAEKAKTIDEVLEKLKSRESEDTEVIETSDPNLLKKVEQVIANKLLAHEQERKLLEAERQMQDNSKKVASALYDVYGDKAEEMYIKRAAEMGMSVGDLNKLAMDKPSVVLELFRVDSTVIKTNASSGGGINTTNLGSGKSYTTDPKFAELAKNGDVKKLMDLYDKYNR